MSSSVGAKWLDRPFVYPRNPAAICWKQNFNYVIINNTIIINRILMRAKICRKKGEKMVGGCFNLVVVFICMVD